MEETEKGFRGGRKTQNIRVKGNITAKRDVIMGDQYNLGGGPFPDIETREQFLSALEDIRSRLEALKREPSPSKADLKTSEAAEGHIDEADQEAKADRPRAQRIRDSLVKAKKMMDVLGSGMTSAVVLGGKIEKLIAIVGRLFGE